MALLKPPARRHSLIQGLHIVIEGVDLNGLNDMNVEVALDVEVAGNGVSLLSKGGNGFLEYFFWIKTVLFAVFFVEVASEHEPVKQARDLLLILPL